MISILGRGLVLLALLFAAYGAPIGFLAGRDHSRTGTARARAAALGFAASMISANLLMIYALVTNDFSVGYVAEVGSTATPLYFKVPSLWASLNGSILFWGGILGAYVALFATIHKDQHEEYMPWALGTLLSVCVFFALLVASIADPFHAMDPVPTDGPGPNPLLQNHWLMAFHPPALYLGYVGMSVPFSMASAALLAGRLQSGWMRPLRRWMLFPWTFLSVGILMGGWWSYAVLGWGGYWAWDPVENASFFPWLAATAALHSALVTQRRGRLRTWTLSLVMGTFLLTIFGTFLTRSGVFNSVHSFTQSDIGPTFLGFLALCFLWSIGLMATRDHVLEDDGDAGAGVVGFFSKRTGRLDPLSREFTIILQNLVFATFTFMVLFGTTYPLLVDALQHKQLSVGEPYFDRMALPLGLLLVFLMSIGPALPWGRMEPAAAAARFGGPALFGLLTVGAFAVGGFTLPYTLLALFLCGFALAATAGELVVPATRRARAKGESLPVAIAQVFRLGRRRYGGLVAHVGIILVVGAIALSKGYKTEKDFTLGTGQSAELGAYTITYTGSSKDTEARLERVEATFVITRDGREVGTLSPALNYFRMQREPVGTPAVLSTPVTDVYLSLVQVEDDGSFASVRAMIMPGVWWLWMSAPFFLGATAIILWPSREREVGAARQEEAA